MAEYETLGTGNWMALHEFQDIKWNQIKPIASWDSLMQERKYKDSVDAYRAIHSALGWAVDAMLEDCDYKKAIEYCELMRDIEGHTVVN